MSIFTGGFWFQPGAIDVAVSPYLPYETHGVGPGVSPEPYFKVWIHQVLLDSGMLLVSEESWKALGFGVWESA